MRVVLAVLGAALVATAAAGAAAPRPWLWQCEQIGLQTAKDRCYERLLLQDIDRSGDPARELPRIDRRAKAAGTSLYANCHLYMHTVGRAWAREHHLTLARLQSVVPQSNDPGCSAGFGMGLVMGLGPQIIETGGRSALGTCDRLPTRMGEFTCVHSLGHALMRGYHESLFLAVNACRKLGPAAGPDCAQGAFHDYWIALRGADESTVPIHAVSSPRRLCAEADFRSYAVQCWYRYWVEKVPGPYVQTAADVLRLCRGLSGGMRVGCIAGAAKAVANETPAVQARICTHMDARDGLACLRGVANQALAGKPAAEQALFGVCARMAPGARAGCAAWFGRTFTVLENGRFRCVGGALRAACEGGARRWRQPLVTFA
ncbi:MAG TPA: hypothetical protein VGK79_02785 [Gaiellaceae bacterium]